jgi:uncharacterized membrane protein YvlD (DUF360 family)
MKVISHCVWVFSLCAVLISPVIVIFGVPLVIGVGTDVVQAGGGPMAAVVIASTLAILGLYKVPVRGTAKALLNWTRRSAANSG